MPPTNEPAAEKSLQQVADELALYPLEAFRFVEEGLAFTARRLGRGASTARAGAAQQKDPVHHITGQELAEGLRDFALSQWGLLAATVLRRWNITCTLDFGRIVFALVGAGRLQKTDDDRLEDFRNVYDFGTAFDGGYRIEQKR
jgi:uncharacterized repeat protein (TIGR04138 family)